MWGWPGASDIKARIKTSFLIHAVNNRGLAKPGSSAFLYHWYTQVGVLQSFCLLASVLPIFTQLWTWCQTEVHGRVCSRMLTWDTCAHPAKAQSSQTHRHTQLRLLQGSTQETQTPGPDPQEQEKTKKPSLQYRSIRWADCWSQGHHLWMFLDCSWLEAPFSSKLNHKHARSKSCRLLCKNRAAVFRNRGKDAIEKFPEKGGLVGVNETTSLQNLGDLQGRHFGLSSRRWRYL